MKKTVRFVVLQIHGMFPFLYPMWKDIHFFRILRALFSFSRDMRRYRRLHGDSAHRESQFPLRAINNYPNLYDRYESAGHVPRHYFYQDIWAAEKVHQSGVNCHYDVGSRLDGFIAHCLSFTKVVMLDIRPLPIAIDNLRFLECDCTNMAQIQSDSIPSISSLHAIEHVGLGRYGDPIDPDGHVKVIREIQRILAPRGDLYFSVPIGKQKLEFNAHRIFDPRYVVSLFPDLTLREFSAIDDGNRLIRHANLDDFTAAAYSCGLFHFTKE